MTQHTGALSELTAGKDDTPLYPLFFSLKGRHCLVVGLGEVGRRKLAALLPCAPATVLVLDLNPAQKPDQTRNPHQAANHIADQTQLIFEARACQAEDVRSKALVFATTSNPAENVRIAALCEAEHVLCNSATDPAVGDFMVPAVARSGPLAAALSTGGASPALARRWRAELEAWLAPRARLVRFMKHLRPLVLAMNAETGQNTLLFRKLASSPLQEWLAQGDTARCRQWLLAELPPALHDTIAELLDDLP